MNSTRLARSLFDRLAFFVLVYAGLYLSVTSISIAVGKLEGLGGSDLYLIVLGLYALIVVIGMAIGMHVLTQKSRAGWQVLVIISPFLSALGALIVQLTPYGAVLVAGFAPCIYFLVDPARIDGWATSTIGIDDGAKVASVLGTCGAVLLLIVDEISAIPCPYTFTGLAIAQLVAGFYMVARVFMPRGKEKADKQSIEVMSISEVSNVTAVSAYFSLLAWALFPVVLIFASKQLAMLSSFGSSIPAGLAGILSLVAFTAGAGIVALLLVFMRHHAVLRLAALAFIGILAGCMMSLALAAGLLDGNGNLAVRLLSFGAIPGAILAMLGAPVPNVKGIAFHFWKVFLMCIGIVLLIVGMEVRINDPDASLYFLAVYLAVLGVAAVPLVISLVPRKAQEVVSK
ncbi:MAG: hypothetical protein Q6373_024815 [Candidatus Sigynarchaeota archaeon]